MSADKSRYEGRPLVRLLDSYVLHAIGGLDEGSLRQLKAMTPQLQQAFRAEGTWLELVAHVMNFPESMPSSIRDVWTANQRIAKDAGEVLAPEDFTVMFVDQNFTPDEEKA